MKQEDVSMYHNSSDSQQDVQLEIIKANPFEIKGWEADLRIGLLLQKEIMSRRTLLLHYSMSAIEMLNSYWPSAP